MMKRLICLTIGFILLLGSAAYARTYKIAMLNWAAWSPANVAETKGFWKDQGLDVKVIVCTSPLQLFTLFKESRIDIAFDMIGNSIGYYMNGLPVRIIAETDWSYGSDKIIVKKDIDLAGLKGKPVGVYANSPAILYFLNRYLSGTGQKISDIRIAEMEADTLASHFIAGYFSMVVCYDPEATRAERDGKGRSAATSASYDGILPEGMIALEDTLAAIPKDDLVRILKGWIKAVSWSRNPSNLKEYMEILGQQTFKDKKHSETELKEMLSGVRIHDLRMQTERNTDGGGLALYLDDVKRFLEENRMLKKEFTPKAIFDNRAIMEAVKSEKE
jgi:NitT/TauT family transport system substrate-binding protein